MAISRFNKAFLQTPWRDVIRLQSRIFIPTVDTDGDAKMMELEPDVKKYVSLSDFEEMDKRFQLEIGMARTNEADARRSAMEVSQREARWMMIEQRLRTTIAAQYPGYSSACPCSRCISAGELLDVLNSDPPVGDGFQTVEGLNPNMEAGALVSYVAARSGTVTGE